MNCCNLRIIFFLTFTIIFCQDLHIMPPRYVSIPGGNATFTCLRTSTSVNISNVRWIINNDDSSHFPNASIEIGVASALHLMNLRYDNNDSNIRCRTADVSSERAKLYIQGPLEMVQHLQLMLQNGSICASWTSPFTLELPDSIMYCVDVVINNSSFSQYSNSTCSISDTEFCYSMQAISWCHRHCFFITPVNQVGNGTNSSSSFINNYTVPALNNAQIGMFTLSMTMSQPVCTAELNFMVVDTGSLVEDTDLNIVKNIILYTNHQLIPNRHYFFALNASNIAGVTTTFFNISTHDIVNVSVEENDGVQVATVYSEISTAGGALFSFVFTMVSGDVDFSGSFLLALDRNTSHNHTLPFDLYPGHYRVYVYDIEHDGTLHNGVGYPAVTDTLLARANGARIYRPTSNDCQFSSTQSSSIRVNCAFPSDTMVTGYQVIAQPLNISQVHKIHTSRNLNLQTPSTVPVEGVGEYRVSVFPIRGGMGILNSSVRYEGMVMVGMSNSSNTPILGLIIGLPILGVIILCVAVIAIVCCVVRNHQRDVEQ